MAKFIQLSTLPYNHFVESSNKQSLFQAAAAAANAFAYNKKKCLALLFIAVVIALVVSFNQIYHLQPTYIPRQLVAICQEDRFYTGSAATCRRTPMVDDNVDCRLCWWPLQTGNYADLLLKNSSAQKVNWFPATDDSYVRCATDCNHFRHLFGYSMSIENVTEEERIFPLAFSILMYEQFEQAERLLRLIHRPQNFYCLHVDGKAPLVTHQAARAVASCLPNVVVAHPPVNVTWGTISILQAEMLCIKELLQLNSEWKYYINLVGRDFPLRTNLELVRIIKAYKGANEIGGSDSHSAPEWTEYVWINGERTDQRKDSPPHNLTLSKGEIHIVARREFVDFALNDRRAQDFFHWLENTHIPDETFYSSLNRNPQLNIPGSYLGSKVIAIVNREKRWVMHRQRCLGQYIRGICSVGIGDLPWVVRSKRMFLNKIRIELDPVAFRCLELWYYDRLLMEKKGAGWNATLMNLEFYENQDFVNHHI